MNAIGHFFHVQPRPELRELYLFSVFFSFASSLILIFEPVFFYVQGYSLSLIAFYYALHYALYVLVLPLGGAFAARFGVERSLALSMPLFIVYFLTLAILPSQPALFWVAWVLLTLHKMFYWPAYHADVCRSAHTNSRGTEISWLFAVTHGVGVIGPLAGGLVATYFGFPALFVLAASLALAASVPLLRTPERVRKSRFAYNTPWQIMAARPFTRARLAMIGWGENLIDLVFWPVFMFIMVGSPDRLGYITGFSVLFMALYGFLVGDMSRGTARRQMLRLHVPVMMFGYLLRPLAAGSINVLLTDVLARSSYIGVQIPHWQLLYAEGRRAGPLRYVVALEMTLAVSKAVLALVLAGVFAVLTPYAGFAVTFLLAGAYALLYLFL
ncbi:MAG: MFS transporter [Candidatus Andersenbacteria bacterium]|nr:MFS transporter [Candidatus Andersenbacteria bacterium]